METGFNARRRRHLHPYPRPYAYAHPYVYVYPYVYPYPRRLGIGRCWEQQWVDNYRGGWQWQPGLLKRGLAAVRCSLIMPSKPLTKLLGRDLLMMPG